MAGVGAVIVSVSVESEARHADLAANGGFILGVVVIVLGVAVLLVVALHHLFTRWTTRHPRAPIVQITGVGSGFLAFLERRSLVWVGVRATVHRGATVLTSWSASLDIGGTLYSGTHAPRPTVPADDEGGTVDLFKLDPLDEATATEPFTGERVGRLAFWLPVSADQIEAAVQARTSMTLTVRCEDSNGDPVQGTIDVLQLYQHGRREWPDRRRS